MYQGRNMIGLDRTGLSDPYVRITLGNQTYRTRVILQTNNPRWKETVIIKEINFYEKLESIIENPPEIILEVFDQDIYGINEFMGKCYVKPVVNMNRVSPPKLKWYRLFHKVYDNPGDILASFELVKKSINEKNEIFSHLTSMNIPISIVPKTSKYSLEILFWGIRNLKINNSVLFTNREKVKIEIEIGGISYFSDLIENVFPNENFHSNTYKKIQRIELPEENEYKPNLNIRCIAENPFSKNKSRLIGSFTVKSINDYFKDAGTLTKSYKMFSYQRFNSVMSETRLDNIEVVKENSHVIFFYLVIISLNSNGNLDNSRLEM
jgi:hypothetical protein